MIKARIEFDENNYIKHFVADWINGNYEVDDDFDFDYLYCYHLVDDEILLDLDKKQKQTEEEDKQLEIEELEWKLAGSDYICARCFEEILSLDNKLTFITDFITILAKYTKQYKDVLAQRKQWRARIEELQGK